MHKDSSCSPAVIRTIALLVLLFGIHISAQSQPSAPSRRAATNPPVATDQKDLAAIQEELITLLRTSPTLTTVVARDPSLLSNQDYVNRNNPQLAQFLQNHPEIARNPDFYLFSHLEGSGRPGVALEHKVWPDLPRQQDNYPMLRQLNDTVGPFLVFVCILGALLWLVRVLLENRRWGRIFKLQTEVHGKLIDRLGSNQELLTYMETEAGKRFLEAAPIPIAFEREQPVPSPVARVLTPLQIGVVLTLLGIGLLFLRHSIASAATPLLIVGIVTLMPGLGFIISAGVTWALARHLGLMPQGTTAHDSRLNSKEPQ